RADGIRKPARFGMAWPWARPANGVALGLSWVNDASAGSGWESDTLCSGVTGRSRWWDRLARAFRRSQLGWKGHRCGSSVGRGRVALRTNTHRASLTPLVSPGLLG